MDIAALILLIIGGLNWLSIGIFKLDFIAWIFGGQEVFASRIVYTLVGISAIWCISFLFKENRIIDHDKDKMI